MVRKQWAALMSSSGVNLCNEKCQKFGVIPGAIVIHLGIITTLSHHE
jgi:hypothetical protein